MVGQHASRALDGRGSTGWRPMLLGTDTSRTVEGGALRLTLLLLLLSLLLRLLLLTC